MLKEAYTPLSQVNTDRIRSTLSLPFRLEEQIGLDTRKVELLSQIAGISHIKIQNENPARTTQVFPQVMGIDGQGTAVSGAAEVSKVPTFNTSYFVGEEGKYKSARWISLNIAINTEETKNVLLKSDQVVNRPNPWAKEINRAIKKSIIESGIRHLISNPEKLDKLLSVLTYSFQVLSVSLGVTAGRLEPQQVLPELIKVSIEMGIVWTFLRPILDGFETSGKGSRWTVVVGPEIDRAIVLYLAASLSKPLAKKIEKPSVN